MRRSYPRAKETENLRKLEEELRYMTERTNKQMEIEPSEASMWWEKGGTPAEARMVYPELFSDCSLTEQSVCV